MSDKFKVEQVAIKLDCSVHTIDNWYRWRRLHETDEEYEHLVSLLPNPSQDGYRQTRYWTSQDIALLRKFKKALPHGRGGVMGDVTGKKGEKHGKKSC